MLPLWVDTLCKYRVLHTEAQVLEGELRRDLCFLRDFPASNSSTSANNHDPACLPYGIKRLTTPASGHTAYATEQPLTQPALSDAVVCCYRATTNAVIRGGVGCCSGSVLRCIGLAREPRCRIGPAPRHFRASDFPRIATEHVLSLAEGVITNKS